MAVKKVKRSEQASPAYRYLNDILPHRLYATYLKVISDIAFTPREIDVMACILSGHATKKIADMLAMASKTVDNHRRNIMVKLGCNSKEGIINFVVQCPQYQLIKQHYGHLLIRSLFNEMLQTIVKSHQETPRCLILHHDSILMQNDWLHTLSKDLLAAGIVVENKLWHDEEDSHQSITQHQITHVLYVPPANIDLKTSAAETPAIKASQDEIIHWLEGLKHQGMVPMVLGDGSYDKALSLPFSDNYYFLVMTILKALYNDDGLQAVVEDFQRRYHYIMGDVVISLQEKMVKSIQSAKPVILAAVVVLLLAMLAIGLWRYSNAIEDQTTNTVNYTQTLTWNLPLLMPYYVERPDITRAIWQHLLYSGRQSDATVLVGLRGLGGVGKSTLAIEAIHHPPKPYAFKGWFKSSNKYVLKNAYFDLGNKYQLFHPEMTEKHKILVVKRWLEKFPTLLLVYDNVPDINMIQNYLPNKGHVIVTSRNHHLVNGIDIDVMQEQEALLLMDRLIPKELTQDPGFKEQIKLLSNGLGFLPLALAQAGAYISTNMVTVEMYLQLFHKMQTDMLLSNLFPAGNQHEPVYVTWDINIKSIQAHPHGKQALEILDLLAYCHHMDIPKKLLSRYIFNSTDEKSLFVTLQSLNLLQRYSLIHIAKDNVSIHQLLQSRVRWKHSKEHMTKILGKGVSAIEKMLPYESKNHQLITAMISHAKKLLSYKQQLSPIDKQTKFMAILSKMYFNIGDYANSQMLFEKILRIYQRTYGSSCVQISDVYYWLGRAYHHLGHYKKSEALLKQSLEIREKHYGEHHIKTAHVYQSLGRIQCHLGHYQKSKMLLEKSLAIYKKRYGTDHSITAVGYHGLGQLYLYMNDYLRSEKILKKALDICVNHYGEDHVEVSKVYQLYATVLFEIGDIATTRELLEKALKIREKYLGHEHVDTAYTYYKLAQVYFFKQDFSKSKVLLHKALKIRELVYGVKHIQTAKIYHALAKLEENKSAKKLLLKQAIDIYEDHFGAQHMQQQASYKNLLVLYQEVDA